MATERKKKVVPAEKVAQERAFIDAQKVHKRISKKLYAFNAAKNLAWAFNSGENIIMFGPGGYGKSEAAVEFFDLLKEEKLVNDDKREEREQKLQDKTPFNVSAMVKKNRHGRTGVINLYFSPWNGKFSENYM